MPRSDLHLLLILLGYLFLAGALLWSLFRQRQLKTALRRCRVAQPPNPEQPQSLPPRSASGDGDFAESLQQAGLRQRLQSRPDWRQPPEKYRFAAALADQGMGAENIAAVLQFPLEAAQQLIALKQAGRRAVKDETSRQTKETAATGRKAE